MYLAPSRLGRRLSSAVRPNHLGLAGDGNRPRRGYGLAVDSRVRDIPALDAVVAVALCLASQVEIWAPSWMIGTGPVDGSRPVLALTSAIGTLALALRQVAPLGMTVLVFGAWGVQGWLTTPTQGLTGLIALALAAYSLWAHASLGRRIAGAVVAVAGITALARDAADWTFIFAFTAAAAGVGLAARRRGRQVVQLRRERDEVLQRERARIARELHDVVSHRVMTTVVQSQAARAQLADPDAVRASLSAIEESGRAALVELRTLLGLLRGDDLTGDRDPQPTLDDLPRLLDEVRRAGVPVAFRTHGVPRPLPVGVSLAAYRIVQEALTNVIKHAGSAATEIAIRYGEHAIEVRVEDHGTRRPRPLDRPRTRRDEGTGVALRRHASRVTGRDGRLFRRSVNSHCRRTVIRIVIVDDQQLVREGFAAIVAAHVDMEVVGLGADGNDALRLCRETSPDVILMDIRMPNLDGIEATRRIAASSGGTRVVMLTTFDLDEHVFDALLAGASGFLLKDAPSLRLAEAVRAAASGETLLDPMLTRRLVERFVRLPPPGRARSLERGDRRTTRAYGSAVPGSTSPVSYASTTS
jgi:DNA-binding NarL/FixJ family response regulator/signal transduction histidine kinase